MSEWQKIDSAPAKSIVMTKIDDDKGARNEAPLHRSGNLWFVPDGSMYVYYSPTHWRPLTDAERRAQIEAAGARYGAASDGYRDTLSRLAGRSR